LLFLAQHIKNKSQTISELNLCTVMGLAPTWTWLLVLFFKLQLKV